MALQQLDWDLIRVFVCLLDTGSLSAAARALDAQQPTLSRQLAALEAQLEAPLFERTGRGLQPTALALRLAEPARRMQAEAHALSRSVQGQRQQVQGSVRISASQMAASYLLPPVLTELRQQHPGIAIELVVSNKVSNLLRREADIAVRMLRPTQSSVVARKLADIALTACAHRDYFARAGRPQTLAQLLQHSLVGYDRDETILRGFAALGVPVQREQFALRTDDHNAYAQLLQAGAGIGFAAHYCLQHWPGVEPVLIDGLRIPPMPCWLAVHREIRGSALIRQVYDALADGIRAQLAKHT